MRVLEEATNKRHPLLERVRFLSISAAFWTNSTWSRVAGLVDMLQTRVDPTERRRHDAGRPAGGDPGAGLDPDGHQQEVWANLQDELREAGVAVIEPGELTETERSWLDQYFIDQVFPILTPLAIDPAHPFPFIPNGGSRRS